MREENDMNIGLGILSVLLCFGAVILMDRLFGKEGLLVWVSLATVIANVVVCKTVGIFGLVSSLGNIMFASNFLATDIIGEIWGKDEANRTKELCTYVSDNRRRFSYRQLML